MIQKWRHCKLVTWSKMEGFIAHLAVTMLHEEDTNGAPSLESGMRCNSGYWSARKKEGAHIAVTHTIYSWFGHKSRRSGDSSAPHSGYCVANILLQHWASKWQKTERPIFYKFWQPGWLFHLCETRIDAGHLCFERGWAGGRRRLLCVSELRDLVPAPESEREWGDSTLEKKEEKQNPSIFSLSFSVSFSVIRHQHSVYASFSLPYPLSYPDLCDSGIMARRRASIQLGYLFYTSVPLDIMSLYISCACF